MIQKIKKIVMTLSFGSLFAVFALAPVATYAQDSGGGIPNNLCNGINLKVDPNGTCSPDPNGDAETQVNHILKLVINIFSILVGFVSVIMIIVGGFKYITSGGDSGNISGAKNTIVYAIIGLVVVALAQVIVRFVLAKAVSTTGGQ